MTSSSEQTTALLIEALARIEAMDMVLGDPGGPRHPKDYWDAERQVRWVEPLATEPPDWDREHDVFIAFQNEHDKAITARSLELRQRVRDEEGRYQERVTSRLTAVGGTE